MRIRVHYAHPPYGLENPQKKNIKVILQINTQIEQIKTRVIIMSQEDFCRLYPISKIISKTMSYWFVPCVIS